MLGIVLATATGAALVGFVLGAAMHRCHRDECRACNGAGARVHTFPDGWHGTELCGCAVGRAYARQNLDEIRNLGNVIQLPTAARADAEGDAS